MGDIGSSSENGRSWFKEWLMGGSGEGRSGNTPQPARSTAQVSESSDEENEEFDDETTPYLSDDPKKPSGLNQRNEKVLRNADSHGGTTKKIIKIPRSKDGFFLLSTCAGCNRSIGYEAHLRCKGSLFHQKCFLCHGCSHPITELEYSLAENKEAYHKSCFKELANPKCNVCNQFIPANKNGLIEYMSNPFWLQKYCPLHDHDNTSLCCCCERLKPWNATYITLRDGRKLCRECKESAVMNPDESLVIYHAVIEFFEGLNVKLDQQIPFILVDKQALNKAIAGKGRHLMSETRSVTPSEDRTLPRTVKTWVVIRKGEVSSILAVYGLPRLELGAELASQLMFSWLHLKGYRNLSPEVMEGICMYLSHMWLELEVKSTEKGKKPEFERKLGEFLIYQLKSDPSCGKGYRSAAAAVNMYGLQSTLKYIRGTGMFPA